MGYIIFIMTELLKMKCPSYKFDSKLDINKISSEIDNVIRLSFYGKKIIVRGVQSAKHDLPKEKLLNKILSFGSDRYLSKSKNAVLVNDRPIDIFGYGCKVSDKPITLSVLEGFHKYKPMCLEKPQSKVDIWLVYDANRLINVEYQHSYYNVKAKDGYVFKDQKNKKDALTGVIVIE